MGDLISRQAAIDALDVGAEFMRRALDVADLVGDERKKCEWGLGLIEACIADVKDLPPVQPEVDSRNLICTIEKGITATNSNDIYSLGMRNGMRWCKSLIDGAEPKFEDDVMSVDDGKELPTIQPVATDINVGDKISKFIDGLEEIFADLRERHVDDSVCGLCEYDGAYIGQSGDWCNECPGFDRDDCFKLSDETRKKWTDEIIKALPAIQPEPAIPLSWIENEIKWLKSLDNTFSEITALQISTMVKKWRDEQNEND